MPDHERLARRAKRQWDAFNECTVDCYRCGRQEPLAFVRPSALGFVCCDCVRTMPMSEYRELVQRGKRIALMLAPHRDE
jgi:recombinational DNA repair protein (RecF pathway)